MALTQTQVSQLYVAIFNRASEGEGNRYWQTQPDAASAADAMLDTTDARNYFGSSLDSNQAFIEHIYQNTLNKTSAVDPDGIAYWRGLLDQGSSRGAVVAQLVGVIENYAPGGPSYDPNDADTVAAYNQFVNRVEVSNYMTGRVEGVPSDYQVATAFDKGLPVTNDPATVTAAKSSVDAIAGDAVSETFVLTTSVDAKSLGAGNDLFIAGESNGSRTLTPGDQLDGGEGTDTLRVSSDTPTVSYAGFFTEKIEILEAVSEGLQTFELSGAEGLTTVKSINSSAGAVFNEVTSLVELEVINLTNTANTSDVTLQYQAAAVAGDADRMAVKLTDSNAENIIIGNTAVFNAGIETIDLVAEGADSTVNTLNTNLTTLTFAGDQNVTITNVLNPTVRTIDASAAFGGLTVAVDTPNPLAFTGGAGDDQATFAPGTLNAQDTVAGGDGTDRLIADQADLIAASARISGMEYIQVQDTLVNNTAGAANVLDAADFPDAARIELALGYNNARIDDLTSAQQRVDILANAPGGNAGNLIIDDGATSFGDDHFTLALGRTGDNNQVAANARFVSGEIETINLISNGDADIAGGNTVNLAGGLVNSNTLNITGLEDLTVVTAPSAITAVNAAEATGDLDVTNVAFAPGSGVTLTTGSGNDMMTGGDHDDTIEAGAGDDVVNGSAGADTIRLGEGRDTVVYTALSQSNATAADTVYGFVSDNDVVNVSGLGATRFMGAQNSFDLAQGALAGGGVISAVFDTATSRLWVDMNGDGTLDGNDFRVTLDGILSVTANDVGLAQVFTVFGGQANTGTEDSDTFEAGSANLFAPGTTVDGLGGNDTLIIQNDPTAAAPQSLAGILSNIENIYLAAGTTIGNALTLHNQADVVVSTADAANVILGTGSGQSFVGSADGDIVTPGAGNQSAAMQGGDDVVNASAANLSNSDLNFGNGNDTLNITTPSRQDNNNNVIPNDLTDGGADNMSVTGLENLTLTGVSSVIVDINSLVVTAGTGRTTVTNRAAIQTVDAAALGANTLTLDGAAQTTVTNLTGAGSNVTADTGAGAALVQVDVADAAAHTLTNNSANTMTVMQTGTAAAGANTVTLTGAGDFNVTSTGGAANGINVNNTGSGAVSVDLNGAGTVTATGTGTLTVDASDVPGGAAVTMAAAGTQDAAIQLGNGNLAAGAYTGGLTVTSTNAASAQNITTGGGTDNITLSALTTASTGTATIVTGAGADSVTINTNAAPVIFTGGTNADATNGIDIITGFRANVDNIDSGVAGPAAAIYGVSSAVATTDANLFANINSAAAGSLTGAKEAVIVSLQDYNGAAGTFLYVDDDANGTVDTTDTIIQLIGTVGVLTTGDFI
jgi:Ca2+-binding RTX toxin-like protein